MSVMTPKICSMAATDYIVIMILSKRESAQGLLSHFMNSPSDCFVSQSENCTSFDEAFERGAIEAEMSNTGVLANNVRVFRGRPRERLTNFRVRGTRMTPLFANYSDQRVGFLLLLWWYPSPFICLSHKNVFNTTFQFPFWAFYPLKPVISLPPGGSESYLLKFRANL